MYWYMVYGIILHYEVGLKQGNKIYSQRYKDGQILNSKWRWIKYWKSVKFGLIFYSADLSQYPRNLMENVNMYIPS